MERYDVLIIGAGPAGLTAGLYCGRARLKTVIVEQGVSGGELVNTARIEDYPGFEAISGAELAERLERQARKFGVELTMDEVVEVASQGDWKRVVGEAASYTAGAVIVAAGGKPKKLDVPGEAELAGRGVSYCAICDGPFFQDQVIAVVGGGNTAIEEADYLTKFGKKVYIIHRRDAFRAQPIIQERALANPKIEVRWNTVVEAIKGQNQVEAVVLKSTVGEERWELPVGRSSTGASIANRSGDRVSLRRSNSSWSRWRKRMPGVLRVHVHEHKHPTDPLPSTAKENRPWKER
jgi:thioredoxin reductase (NADPH)